MIGAPVTAVGSGAWPPERIALQSAPFPFRQRPEDRPTPAPDARQPAGPTGHSGSGVLDQVAEVLLDLAGGKMLLCPKGLGRDILPGWCRR